MHKIVSLCKKSKKKNYNYVVLIKTQLLNAFPGDHDLTFDLKTLKYA